MDGTDGDRVAVTGSCPAVVHCEVFAAVGDGHGAEGVVITPGRRSSSPSLLGSMLNHGSGSIETTVRNVGSLRRCCWDSEGCGKADGD